MRIIIFSISIILHELAHIIVGFLFGYKIKNFKFLPFGTYIEFQEHVKSNNQILKNIIIYLSGPIMNFFISYIFFMFKFNFSEEIIYSNLILGIFNLLPMNPLDGGKILKEIFKIFYDNKRSNLYSYKITKLFLCIFTFIYGILIIKFKNITLFLVLIYMWYIDIKEYKKLSSLIKIYDIIEKCNI